MYLEIEPLYCFGYGLRYTTLQCSDLYMFSTELLL